MRQPGPRGAERARCRTLSRTALLVLSTLSACAASDFGFDDAPGRSRFTPTGAYGAYLSGRFAAQRFDLDVAADKLETAAKDSGVREVSAQAFIAAVMAGRSEAPRLAAELPDNPVAQLVLADADVKAGRWEDAEARFGGLPQQGLTQVLRPLLVAWAQAGQKRTAAALGTLQPFYDSGRFRGVMALHAAIIADLGNQADDAARLYRIAQTEYGQLNLRLGIVLASWTARQGQVNEAQRLVRELANGSAELAIARLSLEADVSTPAVRNARDGIAEAYLAMGATLRQQNAAETAQIMLRLALDMRPDFTAARLLLADMQDGAKRYRAALDTLRAIPDADPLAAVGRLRQATILDSLGETDESTRLLETMAREYPDRSEPLTLAADILRRKSRFEDAIAIYDRAIARVGTPSRNAWPLFYERGIAQERAGRWPQAESDFEFALQLAPDQASVLNYLGYAWTERNQNLDRARDMIQRAVTLRPNEGSFIDSLGWVQLKQGDGPAALRNLERAIELQPEDPVVNGHLGDALAAVGRWREAEYQWRRALTLKPDPDELRRITERLATIPGGTVIPATAPAAAAPNAPVAKP
ncbi:MAG: tetratricopeptide repeat protein [Janthinobacterium lividum]